MTTKSCVVYVVDDEIAIADSVSLVLRAAGFQVTTFYDGAEVLSHAPEFPPTVVVTDFMMPEVDGLVLAAWVEEHYPQCKIVMISGNATLMPAMDRGEHFTLLSKPVGALQLIEIIRERCLAAGCAHPPDLRT
jgi:FixJ family two-component response regulator